MLRALTLICLATSAPADFPATVSQHIPPGYTAFADKTRALTETAR